MAKRHKASDGSAESEPFENSMQTGGSIASDGSDIPELFLESTPNPDDLFGHLASSVFGREDFERVDGLSEEGFATDTADTGQVNIPLVDGEGQVASSSAGHGMPTSNLTASAFRATEFNQFKFPWEKGHLRKVFGSDVGVPSMPSLKPTDRHFLPLKIVVDNNARMTPEIEVADLSGPGAVFVQVVKKGSNMTYLQERKEKRLHALRLWWELLASSKKHSAVGRKIAMEAVEIDETEYALEVLDASFSLKSPGTLLKRYYSVKGYHDWCTGVKEVDWLPMTEFLAWEYVRHLKSSQAAPTRASSFMEGCRFCWYILGVDGANAIETSLRVKGMSAQLKATKRPWLPADCLTVAEVESLHHCLEDSTRRVVDRLLAGHLLHLLYARCRWSDLLAVQNLELDSDIKYLELETQVHKGAKSTDMKSKLLPIVAPCLGVTSTNWAQLYIDLRLQAGLDGPGVKPGHMMPAPDGISGDAWLDRYVTSEEGADFLRLLLQRKKVVGRRISTHSMKSTAISWTSKFGLSVETRAILARHSSSLSNPTILYSRDIISAALREFDMVLTAIRSRAFEPDRTRSGMITPHLPIAPSVPFTPSRPQVPMTPGFEAVVPSTPVHIESSGVKVETKVEGFKLGEVVVLDDSLDDRSEAGGVVELVDSMSETSEESSEQSTSDDDSDCEQAPPLDRIPAMPAPCSSYYINSNTQVIHSVRTGNVFRCGRKLSPNFICIWELNGIRCSRCFDV